MTTIACGVLVLVVFAYVFWPERNSARQPQKTRLEFLGERKQVIYDNLRDLNFEYRAGKYPEEDYAAQRASLENEAAEVIAEMELLEAQPAR
jgi:hypothetical protein